MQVEFRNQKAFRVHRALLRLKADIRLHLVAFEVLTEEFPKDKHFRTMLGFYRNQLEDTNAKIKGNLIQNQKLDNSPL